MMTRLSLGIGELSKLAARNVEFDFLPEANPDGVKMNSRYNARSINLNRNFSVFWSLADENPGQNPFSEPETQNIQKIFRQNSYDLAIDIHGFVNWVVGPSKNEKGSSSQQALHKKWAQALKNSLPLLERKSEYHTAMELGDGGAFEDWAFWEAGVLSYCLEIDSPLQEGLNPQDWQKRLQAYENYIAGTIIQAMALKKDEPQIFADIR